MNAAIIYESLTGNTKKAAQVIGRELHKAGVGVSVHSVTDIDYQALEVADLVIVGTWTDGIVVAGQRPGRAHRLRRLPALDRKRCLVYITYAIDPGKALQKLSRLMEERGANVIGGMSIKRSNLEAGARDFVARLLEALPA
jgi:flavorubredoxin